MLTTLIAHQEILERQGHRRLVVLSGDAAWCEMQTALLKKALIGDWCHIDGMKNEAKGLLGQEYKHGVFDAQSGFNVDAFAALVGTLVSGSYLVLQLPPRPLWSTQIDADSARWSDVSQGIATPQFMGHFSAQLEAHRDVLVLEQNSPCTAAWLNDEVKMWQSPEGGATAQQQHILEQLLEADAGQWVLTAPRGRGKSALAGLFASAYLAQKYATKAPMTEIASKDIWLTAPARKSADVVMQWAQQPLTFLAPDALLDKVTQSDERPDWLIIDEAAAIPTPLLTKLVRQFPRVLFTTTVQGYEGTGRGFLLKFCSELKEFHHLHLSEPLRYAENDPLEAFVNDLLLFDDDVPLPETEGQFVLHVTDSHQLCQQPHRLKDYYALLTSAHYRTSPLDLRRLMDAPGMTTAYVLSDETLIAAAWLVDEGGLDKTLSQHIWGGWRRPRGNLVAQSLSAHGSGIFAPMMKSRRISRIAVHPFYRMRGLAKALLSELMAQSEGLDYLSVSFGYTEDLAEFWQQCGFEIVRIGTHLDASSGCFTAMAMLPLSQNGMMLCEQIKEQFMRNWPYLQPYTDISLLMMPGSDVFDDADWLNLMGFSLAHRPLSACIGSLHRLLANKGLNLPLLQGELVDKIAITALCETHQLCGSKALLKAQREECQNALMALNKDLYTQWLGWIDSIKPVN